MIILEAVICGAVKLYVLYWQVCVLFLMNLLQGCTSFKCTL